MCVCVCVWVCVCGGGGGSGGRQGGGAQNAKIWGFGFEIFENK